MVISSCVFKEGIAKKDPFSILLMYMLSLKLLFILLPFVIPPLPPRMSTDEVVKGEIKRDKKPKSYSFACSSQQVGEHFT